MAELNKSRKQLKRKFISLVDKIEILNRLSGGEKICSVAKSLNLNESTIRTLKKNEKKIRKTIADGCPSGAKRATRTRHVNMVKMERALMIWLEDCVAKKIPVCGNLIKQKALKIYEHLKGINHSSSAQYSHTFTASTGWLQKIKKGTPCTTSNCTENRPQLMLRLPKNLKLRDQIIDKGGYAPDQIFNADETALYWKRLPSRTYISTNERQASGFKASKQRITLNMCSNLSGSLLIKPMIVNCSSTPRAFKNIKMSELPVFWRANKKAWMTQELFKDWFYNCFIPQAESYMIEKNLSFKVLLIIDNASSHSRELNHPNVQIVYLPPNCTSLIQPLDQGVIRTFKMYYIRTFFQTIFNILENDEGKTLLQVWKEFSILDCIRTVSLACAEIKPSTLNKCWRPLLPEMVQNENDISDPLSEILNIVSALSSEEFADLNHEDIEELLREESLNEEELVELIDESTSNESVEENTENGFVSNFSYDLKKGLNLAEFAK